MNTQLDENTVHPEIYSRNHHRRSSRSDGWVGGMMLIALGIFLLLRNFVDFDLNNWWAMFILLPAVGAFSAAWRNYQEAGRITASVRGSIFGGLCLVMVATAFFFNLNWAIVGPMMLLAAGVGILVNTMLPQ